MVEELTIRISPREAADEKSLRRAVSRALGARGENVGEIRVVRRSVDARKRPVMLSLLVRVATDGGMLPEPDVTPPDYPHLADDAPRVVIVGAGPAGLFAALRALELGWRPMVLERGRDVDSRRKDLAQISRTGVVDPQSNYCFGEGGAGAYSDGKLFTRSKKRGNVEAVLRVLVQHGAPRDILVDAHPHIGSDRLPKVIKSMRESIIAAGGNVRFDALVEDLIIDNGVCKGVVVNGEEIMGDAVILATGHSARDTFRLLHRRGVAIQPKGIAVGVRLEHPQKLIDSIQYHSPKGRGEFLPAAEYSFVTQVDGRGVYSFCMCPGGVVVPAASEPGLLVVNGMSASARAGKFANSGMVVEVREDDFPQYSAEGPLALMAFQEDLERKFYKGAGDSIKAPAQRMLDFVEHRKSESLPSTSYAPGILSAEFDSLFPPEISERLRKGFLEFGRKSKGFLTNDAILLGLESRTSSPVRVTRDAERLESVNVSGLFPAGEGAGYAGGIVSAAIDGMKCMEAADIMINRKNMQNV